MKACPTCLVVHRRGGRWCSDECLIQAGMGKQVAIYDALLQQQGKTLRFRFGTRKIIMLRADASPHFEQRRVFS